MQKKKNSADNLESWVYQVEKEIHRDTQMHGRKLMEDEKKTQK